jgi:hypothetical protein
MTERGTSSGAEDASVRVLNGAKPPKAEEVLELFAQLEPVSIDSVIGLWRLAAFGRAPRDPIASQPDPDPLPQHGGLGMHNLYGKRFVTRDDAEPIAALPRTVRLSRPSTSAWPACANSTSEVPQAPAWCTTSSLGSITSASLTATPRGHDRYEGQADGHRLLYAARLTEHCREQSPMSGGAGPCVDATSHAAHS